MAQKHNIIINQDLDYFYTKKIKHSIYTQSDTRHLKES